MKNSEKSMFTRNVLIDINTNINIFWYPHIDIDIFNNVLFYIDININIFKKILTGTNISKNGHIDIHINIFKNGYININIFKKGRYIDNQYGLSIYQTPLPDGKLSWISSSSYPQPLNWFPLLFICPQFLFLSVPSFPSFLKATLSQRLVHIPRPNMLPEETFLKAAQKLLTFTALAAPCLPPPNNAL